MNDNTNNLIPGLINIYDNNKQIETTTNIPTTQIETTTNIPTTQIETTAYIPTTQIETTAYIPTTQLYTTTYIPNTQIETSTYIPTTQLYTTTYIPTTQIETSTYIPTTQIETSTYIPTTQMETTTYIPTTQIETSTQIQPSISTPINTTIDKSINLIINNEIMTQKNNLISNVDKNIISTNTTLINNVVNPNIITTEELLNPSYFIYNNIYLIDILNSDKLYPINTKTDVLNTTIKRKELVNVIVELYSVIIAICNYCIDKNVKNNLIIDMKNIYLDFKSKNWALFHVNDDKKNYDNFINNLNDKIKTIYDKTFLVDNLYKPIIVLSNYIDKLKTLNINGSNDEINISNFIINMYQTIIILSYYVINNNIDVNLLFSDLVNKNYNFIDELKPDYRFLHYNLFIIDLSYKKKYISISEYKKLDLIDKMNLLINSRLKLLLKTLPNNVNDNINKYNNDIVNYISLIENNNYINKNNVNVNNYPLNELFNDIKYNLKTYISDLNKSDDETQLIICNIYKCILQLIIECEYIYLNINDNKYIEGFSKFYLNINCVCKSFLFIVFIIFIYYLMTKNNLKK